jgi:hypothetical protein
VGKTTTIGTIAHDAALGIAFKEPAQSVFAGASGIDVRGIEEIDAEIERLLEERLGARLVQRPRGTTRSKRKAESKGRREEPRPLPISRKLLERILAGCQ